MSQNTVNIYYRKPWLYVINNWFCCSLNRVLPPYPTLHEPPWSRNCFYSHHKEQSNSITDSSALLSRRVSSYKLGWTMEEKLTSLSAKENRSVTYCGILLNYLFGIKTFFQAGVTSLFQYCCVWDSIIGLSGVNTWWQISHRHSQGAYF